MRIMDSYSKWADSQAELLRLRESGKTLAEIGSIIGVSRQRVFQIVNHTYQVKSIAIPGISRIRGRPRKQRQFSLPFNFKSALTTKERYYQGKETVLTYYGKGKLACVLCGFTDTRALSIDHINGDGAAHRKTFKGSLYNWLIKHKYPAGFRTLCMNCQWITKSEKHLVRSDPNEQEIARGKAVTK